MSVSKSVRITRMTKREKDAASIGRALNERIPAKELRKLLPIDFDEASAAHIMAAVARAVGEYRFWQGSSVQNMEPQEIRDQARSTAEVVDELMTRLRCMHWEVKALVDADLYRLNRDTVATVTSRLEPELFRLRAALTRTAANLDKQKLPKGRKPNTARNEALRAVFQAIRGVEKIGVEDARSLAGELLRLAEPTMPIPSDRGELKKAMPGK